MLESINVRRFLKVGDTVAVADDLYAGCEPPKFRTPSIGESGTIRRIFISDPDDGDATFLLFELKFKRLRLTHTAVELEIVHPHEAESMLWLRRQLAELPQ